MFPVSVSLCLQLCSSEQLQHQIFLLNQQLVLLRETNRALTEQLDGGDDHCTVRTETDAAERVATFHLAKASGVHYSLFYI